MQVLRVRGAYGNRDCPHIETTVESANEINSWGENERDVVTSVDPPLF